MSDPKPLASLSPTLLARKGAARPAMRPQLQPLSFEEQNRILFGNGSQAAPAYHSGWEPSGQEDLGWNDMGEDHDAAFADAPAPEPVVAITPAVAPAAEPVPQPEVLRRIEALASAVEAEVPAAASAVPAPVIAPQPARRRGSALKEGRKAAFTLRIDAERHLRLRLACTVENRSAQQVLIEALDRFLETQPGLDDLARRARRN